MKLSTRRAFAPGHLGLYAFLFFAALYFLLPLYVMIVTSLKTMDEIRLGQIFALPLGFDLSAWSTAWSGACIGGDCTGIQAGFWNSVKITIPSVVLSVLIGALNGYALTFWRSKSSDLLFALLMVGGLMPFQIFLYPMVLLLARLNLYNSLGGIVVVHVVFGLPLVTLLFRNYYRGVPDELARAARIEGAGFWRIFTEIMLPLSMPMIAVASIIQFTSIWNDFLFGLVFAGRDNLPMTVELNNIVNSTMGERAYNVNMAATILTALVPLFIFFFSGRLFVRGITTGSVKG